MKRITYTLLTDGSSDKTLMSIIDWLLNDLSPTLVTEKQFADLRMLREPPTLKALDKRIDKAIELYPCDILFVHRDAEKNDEFQEIYQKRSDEIEKGFGQRNEKLVKIIPIKMMEAWLLIDELSIKKAAENRNSTFKFNLPATNKLEKLPDPKKTLHELLRNVSQKKGRRLDNFNVSSAVHLVADNIEDYSVLRGLYSFDAFEKEVTLTLKDLKVI